MRGLSGLALITVLAAFAAGQEARERESAAEAMRPQQARTGDGPAAESMATTIFPVVLGAPFIRVQHGGGSVPDAATVRAAFASRLGSQVVDADGGWQTEDLVLEAVDGCPLSYYEFDLGGQLWAEQDFEPFNVEFGLYRGCDLYSESATEGLIAGTGGTLTIAQGGPTTVVVVPQQQVLLPGVVWLGVRFSRESAGLIAGGAPEVGHSTPGVGWARTASCFRQNLGYAESGTINPYFNVRLFVPATCPKAHPVYANSRSGICANSRDSQGEWLVDDALLEGGPCLMRAYEFTVVEPGVYDTELRTACDGPAIAGTQRSEFVKAPGQTRVRHTFNPPIPLPQQVWIAGRNLPEAGSFGLAGRPPIGATNSGICLPESTSSLGLAASVYCDGEPPVGACCDMHQMQCDGGENEGGRCETNDHCPGGQCATRCREVTKANCPYEGRDETNLPEWVADAACDPDPFEAMCGVAACCTPLYGCLDLTREECEGVAPPHAGAYWDNENLCPVSGNCVPPACVGNSERCTVSHDGAGCQSQSCCRDVCAVDPWCCQIEWDRSCVERVAEECVNLREGAYCDREDARGAMPISTNTSFALAKIDGSTEAVPACVGACSGGDRHESACLHDSDCPPEGKCTSATVPLWNLTWLRFTATSTSIRLSTCESEGGDSVIILYRATDPTTPQSACASMHPQTCAFGQGCEDQQQSCVCFTDLTPGETYYAVLGSMSDSTGEIFRVDVTSPCSSATCSPPNDCNGNGQADLLDIAHGPSLDCQWNMVPDECELGSEGDCNQNRVPDTCDLSSEFSEDCNNNQRPDECDVMDGAADCDGNGFIDDCEPTWERVPTAESWISAAKISAFWENAFVFYDGRSLHVAELEGNVWLHKASLNATSGVGSLAVINNWIFAGAQGQRVGDQISGAVHTFELSQGSWQRGEVLVPLEQHDLAAFGWSLAAEGNVLVVGSPSAPDGGAAYVFEMIGGRWFERQVLRPPDQLPEMRFGISVSVSGELIAVSQWIDNVESRAVHLFRARGSVWEYHQPIHVNSNRGETVISTYVDIAGEDAVIGVPRMGGIDVGQVFTYSLWNTERAASVIDGVPLYFGETVQISGNTLVVGKHSGTISVYRRDGSGWNLLTRRSSPPGAVHTDGIFAASGGVVLRLGPNDCNASGIADTCDIEDGLAHDCNLNQVLDLCESLRPFDQDFDRDVDLVDFARMQGCFTGPEASLRAADCCRVFDGDGDDGFVDAADYAAFPSAMIGP